MSNVDSLAKASKDLMLEEPFYGLLLMSLNKTWSDSVPTAGVGLKGINYQLIINPEFWESLPPIQQKGLLKHELLHIAFFHLTDYAKYLNKDILNKAMDIEINQYIKRDWLPENGCFLENYPVLQGEETKGTIWYYEQLMKENSKGNKDLEAMLKAMAEGKGTCTLPGNGETVGLPQHDWDVIEELDEPTKKLINSQTKHIVNQVAEQVTKSRGTIPGEMQQLLERINQVEPPKFDWKGYMRRFAGKSVKTYTKKSRRKLNKRLIDNPGLKIVKQKHILAAIDTSGSVSTNELKEFLGEMYHMKKTGAQVTIIECDTAIAWIGPYDPKRDLPIHGRGGTSFQPVIDYYNQHNKDYSCLFYFTDGEAPAPDDARGNILWVLSSVSGMNEDLPGHVIKLEE